VPTYTVLLHPLANCIRKGGKKEKKKKRKITQRRERRRREEGMGKGFFPHVCVLTIREQWSLI